MIFLFPTAAPKPRAEGSSPSAPATGKALKPLGFRAFSLRFRGRRTVCFAVLEGAKNGVNFPSGGIRSQRFRLLHHQNSIKILAPAAFQPELFFVFCGTNSAHLSSCSGGHFRLYLKSFGDPVQPCCILFDIVKFGYLRGRVSEQIRHLPG